MAASTTRIKTWGNGLAIRLPKATAKLAGFDEGTRVRITVVPGRIVVQAEVKPTLEQMLAAFDPVHHGGEVLSAVPIGREVIR